MIHIAPLPAFHSSVKLLWKWGEKSDCAIKSHSDIVTVFVLFLATVECCDANYESEQTRLVPDIQPNRLQ